MSKNFVFLNENPEQQDSATFRRKVRSQAATYSHRIAPRRGSKSAKYQSRQYAPEPTASSSSIPQAISRSISASLGSAERSFQGNPQSNQEARPVYSCLDDSKSLHQSPITRSPTHGQLQKALRRASPSALFKSPAPIVVRKSPAQRLRKRPRTPIAANIGRKRARCLSPHDPRALVVDEWLPDPVYMDASQKDPFNMYPVPYQKWFGWLLDYWYAGVLPRSKSLIKASAAQMDFYINWSRSFELTEPALFYTSLFLATGIPVANSQLHVEKALWLRGQAVRALNEALDDPARATSNAVISAVGKIALHEHIYGDRQAAHSVHRIWQQRMIAMRGGIENLGFPTITLQLMVWYDALMAAESGTTAYFADLPRKLSLQSYRPDEAVRVTNESSPYRHRHPGYGESLKSPRFNQRQRQQTRSTKENM